MNASLYQLKSKFDEGTQGNRKWWLAAGLVLLVALMVYAQVHNALGARLAAASTAAQVQPASALTVNGVAADTSPITQHQRSYMPSALHGAAVSANASALVLPHYSASARHGAACNELPAGTPGCQGLAVAAPGANAAGNARTCAPVSRAAQHWDKNYISPC